MCICEFFKILHRIIPMLVFINVAIYIRYLLNFLYVIHQSYYVFPFKRRSETSDVYHLFLTVQVIPALVNTILYVYEK